MRVSTELIGDEAMRSFGGALSSVLTAGDVIALSGDLGAGKTTLARGILEGLGYHGDVPSPTFTLIQIYERPDVRLPVWHVDLYRLTEPDEAEELGLEEALDAGALLVEWPERLGGWMWPQALVLNIAGAGMQQRVLTAELTPAWEQRWPFR